MRRAADVPLSYNAVDILERNLGGRPDKVALYSADRTLTFRQVSAEVDMVAAALRGKLGLRQGEAVAILAPDRAEWVSSFFGIIKAGGVAASLNTLSTPDAYDYMLRDSRARVLVVDEALLELVERVRASQPFLEHVVVIGATSDPRDLEFGGLIAGQPGPVGAAPTHRDDLCMLNYSSGTTGEPKGIPHAHKDLPLTAQLYGVEGIGLREDDRTFSVAKLFFTYGSGGNLIWPWYAGASVILSSAPSRVATNLLSTIDQFKPTVFNGVPTSYAAMMAVDGFPERFDLGSLRMCLSAGEALPVAIWEEWKRRTGHEIVEGIGTTEVLALFLTNRLGEARPGSVGRPVPGYDIKIVGDDGRPVPRGETGNLMVRGETAVLAYLHQYERSRQTFLGEWTSTGDRFREDEDGYFWYVGRSDDMLKVGGIWVSPLEIENALVTHEAVQECAVIGAPDPSDLIKPKAFVVLQPGREPSPELAAELVEHCRSNLAAFKRPRWVEFVSELPRTPTGKLQRARLR
jgi:benzoate-CoA ligase family protein